MADTAVHLTMNNSRVLAHIGHLLKWSLMDSLTFVDELVQIGTFMQQPTVAWYSLRLNKYVSLTDTATAHLSARCSNLTVHGTRGQHTEGK